jgi:hypothetical protein
MWYHFWPIYERLEAEMNRICFGVALWDSNLNVFSSNLCEYILRIGQQSENCAREIIKEAMPAQNEASDNFPKLLTKLEVYHALRDRKVELIYPQKSLGNNFITPFARDSDDKNPEWFAAYNKIKHDQAGNFESGNLKNAVNGLACLFILNLLLRKSEIEAESEHINFARRRIRSYSDFFNCECVLKISESGGVTRKIIAF